ncbi:peptidyl-prolyl cis-trans isomerase [bacterium]|nr:peptidyl-prolyl cis-trans isomerase [candidate division CSSED10-310 bacterium]
MIVLMAAGIPFLCVAAESLEDIQKEMGTIVVVEMQTTKGTIEIALFQDKAPITVKNFLQYVDDGFYAGTVFHRVIDTFMIQGGGLTADLTPKETRPPIKNEATNGLKNTRGTIAMARTGIVDSATSQFFINVVDNETLNHRDTTSRGFGYAVFGKVIAGMDVVDAIKSIPTGSTYQNPDKKHNLFSDVPVEPVTITSMRRK